MKQAVRALEVLEERQAELHTTLREAGFALSAAQRVEEQRGNLCTMAAVPSAAGALQPLVHLQCAQQDDKEEVGASVTAAAWALHIDNGVRPTLLPRSSNSSSGGGNASAKDDAAKDDVVDPLYYFSALPSQELRESQALYRKALQQVVAVVSAQHAALAAAAQYATDE